MTWSIIARDEPTGRIGIVVATRFFAVGAMVPHIKTGVGAIASQAFINPLYGPQGLALLEAGLGAEETVGRLTAADAGRDNRQLHAMDKDGRFAAYTGVACIDWCGHAIRSSFSVAGNMLAGPAVLADTIRAYEAQSAVPFARRLIAAMQAGEAAGGDKRGKQSGGAAGPRRRGLPALRPARRRSRRSPGRAGAAARGGARTLGAFPAPDAHPPKPLGADRPKRARGAGRKVHRGGL